MRDILLAGAALSFALSEIVTIVLAFAVWGPLGAFGAGVLGPIGAIVVTLATGMSGPMFWLVLAAVLYALSAWGRKTT